MTWEVGDLALCVIEGGWFDGTTLKPVNGPANGWTGIVRKVWVQAVGTMLCFDEHPFPGCSAAEFRKIRPDEHQSCEPEFVALLKRSKAPSPQEREKRILEALFGANAVPAPRWSAEPEPVSRLRPYGRPSLSQGASK